MPEIQLPLAIQCSRLKFVPQIHSYVSKQVLLTKFVKNKTARMIWPMKPAAVVIALTCTRKQLKIDAQNGFAKIDDDDWWSWGAGWNRWIANVIALNTCDFLLFLFWIFFKLLEFITALTVHKRTLFLPTAAAVLAVRMKKQTLVSKTTVRKTSTWRVGVNKLTVISS